MNTTIRVVDEDHCAVCRQPARCVIVTIADEAGDMRRSALTLRTVTTAICRSCIDRAFVQREPGKRHLWHDPGEGVAAVVRAACEVER